ncbi:MAG TPA: NUDIX domain-containing protein [archaeon]|nr:NUDIX domain-containing protein [archaeon]
MDFIGVGCGALILNGKGETLLMKRGPKSKNEAGFWSKPGGTVELGELVEDAIRREIKEELNVDIELLEPLKFTDHHAHGGQHWIALNYTARIVKGEPRIMEPEKIAEVGWFPLNKLPSPLTATTSEPIEEYLRTRA